MKRQGWPLWFKAGLISIGFGVALFFVYASVLAQSGSINPAMQILMMITGHFLFIVVGFSYPGWTLCGLDRPACSNAVDSIAMLAVCAILVVYYFGIGALIGRIAEKILRKKQ